MTFETRSPYAQHVNLEASPSPLCGYIATDRDQSTGAIYGVGDTPAAALADAREHSRDTEAVYGLVAATRRLIDSVVASGGGPGDQDWSVYTQGGEVYAGDLETDPADVRDYRLADLEEGPR